MNILLYTTNDKLLAEFGDLRFPTAAPEPGEAVTLNGTSYRVAWREWDIQDQEINLAVFMDKSYGAK